MWEVESLKLRLLQMVFFGAFSSSPVNFYVVFETLTRGLAEFLPILPKPESTLAEVASISLTARLPWLSFIIQLISYVLYKY